MLKKCGEQCNKIRKNSMGVLFKISDGAHWMVD